MPRTGSAAIALRAERAEAVLSYLQEHGPKSVVEIAIETELGEEATRNALADLHQAARACFDLRGKTKLWQPS